MAASEPLAPDLMIVVEIRQQCNPAGSSLSGCICWGPSRFQSGAGGQSVNLLDGTHLCWNVALRE